MAGRRGAWWLAVILAGIVVGVGGMVVCAGAALVFRDRLQSPALAGTSGATATRTQMARRRTATPRLSATPTALPAARATSTSLPTATRRSTRLPPTPTSAPSRTPIATRRVDPTPTPTPIVCDGLTTIGQLTLMPGQAFACTVSQEALNEQLRQQPDLPCSDVGVTLTDGEIRLVCQMGIRLTATGTVDVQDCRMSITIVKGTIGFTQVVQTLLDEGLLLVPYDKVCVEQATVGNGEIAVSGYGR